MTIRFSTACRTAGLDAMCDLADAGAGAATIEIRTGSQPATANTAASGSLLATITCADPAFEAASSGAIDLDANPDLSAVASGTGTAGWARMLDSNGNAIFDGSVGTSGTDYIINSTSITSGQTVTLTLGTITDPA